MSAWELTSVLSNLALILGLVAAAGGVAALKRYHDGSRAGHEKLLAFSLGGAAIGFHFSLLPVLLQVGQINDSGLMGMFDLELLWLLRGTPAWDAAAFRGTGFFLSILLILTLLRVLRQQKTVPPSAYYRIAWIGQLLALGLVAYGFTLVGHVSVLAWLPRLALLVHVTAIALWFGMLVPLRWCCADPSLSRLQRQMQSFSRWGIGLVVVLVLTGATLLLSLIPLADLFATSYGRVLCLKLLLVAAVLVIASFNKWRHVPRLELEGGRCALRSSIDREIALGVALVLVSAAVSTLLGPAEHMPMSY